MKLKESPTLEFKRELTDAIKHEIIAFANTQGGELYIGINKSARYRHKLYHSISKKEASEK